MFLDDTTSFMVTYGILLISELDCGRLTVRYWLEIRNTTAVTCRDIASWSRCLMKPHHSQSYKNWNDTAGRAQKGQLLAPDYRPESMNFFASSIYPTVLAPSIFTNTFPNSPLATQLMSHMLESNCNLQVILIHWAKRVWEDWYKDDERHYNIFRMGKVYARHYL